MVNAGGVGNHQRRSRPGFSLGDRAQRLIFIGAHGDLGHVHIAVAHRHHAKIFFPRAFALRGKLRDGRHRGRFRRLPAGIGVNLGIKHQNIHVFPARQHVIETAEADIVGPAVAAENPLRPAHKIVAVLP